MDNIPDGQCNYCLPDCSTTLYHATVTAAPFRKCDYKNLGVSYLCNFDTKQSPSKPPIWGQQVIDQYLTDLDKSNINDLPNHIKDFVKSNTRLYDGEYLRTIIKVKLIKSLIADSRAAGNPLFKASTSKSPSYDAYEKDIAMVTFFFESTTVFEYTRDERMTLIQYISQIGGLMGLCAGFSFISAVEILYWFTIRYFRNL